MDGQQIYENFAAGRGAAALTDSARTLRRVVVEYLSLAAEIRDITTAMEANWQGDASGAARRGAAPLVVEHELAAPDLDKAGTAGMAQGSVFEATRAQVQPVPTKPEQPGLWDNITSLGGASRNYEDEMRKYNEANERNVIAMRNYETATAEFLAGLSQAYGTMVEDKAAVQVVDEVEPARVTKFGGYEGRTGTSAPPVRGEQYAQQPGGGHQEVVVAAGGSGLTGPSSAGPGVPVPVAGPPVGGPGGPVTVGVPPHGGGPGSPSTGYPGAPTGIVAGPAGNQSDSGGRGGGRGAGDGRGSANGGRGGPGAGGDARSGARGGFDGGSGRGSAVGGADAEGRGGLRGGLAGEERVGNRVGAGVLGAGEGFGGRGGSAAGGRGGGGFGGPVAGGAGANGEDDGEHSAPEYLVVDDPDALFGNDAVTAPPVIGG